MIDLPPTDVIIYTIPKCPYCIRAKELLNSKDVPFTEIDVSNSDQRTALVTKAQGRKTVPQIFIRETHVGGYDDLRLLEDQGKLDPMLAR